MALSPVGYHKKSCRISEMPLSPVNFKKDYCRCVELKKRSCRPVDFRGLHPWLSHWYNFENASDVIQLLCLYFSGTRKSSCLAQL